jgi:hypothetical protein
MPNYIAPSCESFTTRKRTALKKNSLKFIPVCEINQQSSVWSFQEKKYDNMLSWKNGDVIMIKWWRYHDNMIMLSW